MGQFTQRCGSSLLFPLVFLLTTELAAQDPKMPVPLEWVSGATLTVKGLNFAVTAPDGWRWRHRQLPVGNAGRMTSFLASNLDSNLEFIVIAWQKTAEYSEQIDTNEFVNAMASSLPAGWKSVDVQVRRSRFPTPGSSRFQTKFLGPDNAQMFQYAYVVPGPVMYMLVSYTSDRNESDEFVTFVRSFYLLNPTGSVNDSSKGIVPGLLLVLSIVGAGIGWQYVKAGLRSGAAKGASQSTSNIEMRQMIQERAGSSRAVRFARWLGMLLMSVGALGFVAFFAGRFIVDSGPFHILSGLVGYSIIVCFGYRTLSADPKARSYWWAVLGPFFLGLSPISFLLLATNVGIATWFRRGRKRDSEPPLSDGDDC
jgi:hypothetical protein